MCNPRRVMIHLSRHIEEAWRQTIERTATASGQVTERARVTARVPLAEEMGDLPLQMLVRVLAGEFEGYEPWARGPDGCYTFQVDQVSLRFNPATSELTMESALSEMLTADARAAAEASGFTVGEAAAEAVGNYYSDGWGGRTEERARVEASAEAERRLTASIEALHAEQNAQALAQAAQAADAAAQAAAEARLAALQEEVRLALRRRLQSTLAETQDRVYHVINRAVGEAYRQSLLQIVLDNGGRVLLDQQTGSVINMELELY